jgi:hypothetical protein
VVDDPISIMFIKFEVLLWNGGLSHISNEFMVLFSMNDFFLRVESSSKTGTVYRIYARESREENENKKNSTSIVHDQLIQDHSDQNQAKNKRKGKKRQIKRKKFIASANSWRVNLIEPYIKETIKKNPAAKGYQRTLDGNKMLLDTNNENDIVINEEDGVRLSILFKSISRLQKMARIDCILANVRTMNREEAYYWYSKIFQHRKNTKGMRAFRDLFG